jgi:hypothetical protein
MLGNVFPRESVGRIVRLNLPRDPGHHCHHLNPGSLKRAPCQYPRYRLQTPSWTV